MIINEESDLNYSLLGQWVEKYGVIDLLRVAQERLETGLEVNRSIENAIRVTATSIRIREALYAVESFQL